MHGANIGIDIGKTELSFSFNNLHNTIRENHEPVYGASVKGGNKEGISKLFKKGEFITQPRNRTNSVFPFIKTQGNWSY